MSSAVERAAVLRAWTDKIVGVVLVGLFAALTIDVVWQVIARYSPVRTPASLTAFTEELARSLLLWLALLGSAYVAGARGHLAIDLLSRRLPAALRRWHALLVRCLVAIFGATVLSLGGAGLVWTTFDLGQVSASLRISVGVIYLALPIGGMLIIWYASLDAVQILGGGEAAAAAGSEPEGDAWTG